MKKSYRVVRQCLSSNWVYPDYILQDSSKAARLGHVSAVTGSPAQAASLANRKLQLSRAVSSWGSTDLFEGSWWIASLLATGFLLSPSISSCDEPPGNASGNVDPQKDDPAAAAAAAEAAAAVGDYSLLRELLQPVEGPKKTVYEELNRLEATLPPFRVVQPPKPLVITSLRSGELQVDVHIREGLDRFEFLTALKVSGWKVAGGAFSKGSTKIEIVKGALHAAVLMPTSKNGAEAALSARFTCPAGASAGEDTLGSIKSLMHAANSMVEEKQRSDGSILRYWDLPAGEEGFEVMGRTMATLHEADIPVYLKAINLDLRARCKIEEALLRDMREVVVNKTLQGFKNLQDEFLDAASRSVKVATTPKVLKPEDPGPYGSATARQAAAKLQKLGCTVSCPQPRDTFDWDSLAGCPELKTTIEDTLILVLREPEVYDEVARATRKHFQSNRPRAILFEGPPGCGKTTTARIIASQASVPLVHVPMESFKSEWYGKAEKNLAEIFKQTEECGKPSGGAILFLDELDAVATYRRKGMGEAAWSFLGMLLRSMDGFALAGRCAVMVIGATNRKQDLDHALLSRFSVSIPFGLPDIHTRKAIIKDYAQQLGEPDVAALAAATDGASGRDLRVICEQAERTWASQIVRGKADRGSVPPISSYMDAAKKREQELWDPTQSYMDEHYYYFVL